jgi:hypothetical protein
MLEHSDSYDSLDLLVQAISPAAQLVSRLLLAGMVRACG